MKKKKKKILEAKHPISVITRTRIFFLIGKDKEYLNDNINPLNLVGFYRIIPSQVQEGKRKKTQREEEVGEGKN